MRADLLTTAVLLGVGLVDGYEICQQLGVKTALNQATISRLSSTFNSPASSVAGTAPNSKPASTAGTRPNTPPTSGAPAGGSPRRRLKRAPTVPTSSSTSGAKPAAAKPVTTPELEEGKGGIQMQSLNTAANPPTQATGTGTTPTSPSKLNPAAPEFKPSGTTSAPGTSQNAPQVPPGQGQQQSTNTQTQTQPQGQGTTPAQPGSSTGKLPIGQNTQTAAGSSAAGSSSGAPTSGSYFCARPGGINTASSSMQGLAPSTNAPGSGTSSSSSSDAGGDTGNTAVATTGGKRSWTEMTIQKTKDIWKNVDNLPSVKWASALAGAVGAGATVAILVLGRTDRAADAPGQAASATLAQDTLAAMQEQIVISGCNAIQPMPAECSAVIQSILNKNIPSVQSNLAKPTGKTELKRRAYPFVLSKRAPVAPGSPTPSSASMSSSSSSASVWSEAGGQGILVDAVRGVYESGSSRAAVEFGGQAVFLEVKPAQGGAA
ncbi:Hypothetical protein D9617_9g023830 [Elsinoe fawcettii]|nr:Hypothetical protein D9617_9g023830 [Elsinoe fawcettii]